MKDRTVKDSLMYVLSHRGGGGGAQVSGIHKKEAFQGWVSSMCSQYPKPKNKTAFVCRSFVIQPFVGASITGNCGVQCPVATRKATLDVPGHKMFQK